MIFRILPLRSLCRFSLPILSVGGIMVGEEYCLLPKGHDGPHKGPHGQLVANHEGFIRGLEKQGEGR